MCKTCCVNGCHRKRCQNFPTHFGLSLSLECSGEISQQSVKSTYPINSLKVECIPPKIKCKILARKGS